MFGLILILSATFFEEVSTAVGKVSMRRRLESPYSFGFISNILLLFFFFIIIAWRWDSLVFSWSSLPFLAVRTVLEIVLATITLNAIAKADRSTFGFMRTLTIPLVLLVDLVLGYNLTPFHMLGVALIVGSLLFLFLNHGLGKRGIWLSLVSAILGAATTSLFKYSITNFNSPEIDQTIINGILLVYFFIMARLVYKESAFASSWSKRSLVQSALAAVAGIVGSYAFLFAPASIIMAGKRAMSVFWSVLSGRTVFHERRLAIKLIAFCVCALGLSLLAV